MMIVVNGVRLNYEVRGDTRTGAPPILFIHGFPLTGELWRPVGELVQNDHRLIIPDLRGFGESELTPNPHPGVIPPASIAQYADDLFVLLNSLDDTADGRPVTVVGLSMGGYVALEFHRRYTARVQALVLANTRAQPDSPEKAQERFATAQKVMREGSGAMIESMMEKLFTRNAPETLRATWREIMSSVAPSAVAAALHAMAGRGSHERELARILCPTLIVAGAEDAITPIADAQFMHERILMSELAVIPEAAHLTPVEQPEMFAMALRDFLQRQVPREPLPHRHPAFAP